MSPGSENKQKLESFFKDEYQNLKGYVGSRIKASASKDAEDIIQDVAFNLFAGAGGYGPISNVAGFVYRSIKNKIVDNLRRKQPEYSDIDNYEWAWREFSEMMYGSSEMDYSTELIEELKIALRGLSPPEYQLIFAVDFQGYTFREISVETGIPEGTLMSKRHRALAKLNKELKEKREQNFET